MSSQKLMTFENFLNHSRVAVVQVRLVREEAVPIVGLGDGIPMPVGLFGIAEDDAGLTVFLVGVAPDVEIAFRRAGRRLTGGLKPGMLIGGVIYHQFDHDLETVIVRRLQEDLEIFDAFHTSGERRDSRRCRSRRP